MGDAIAEELGVTAEPEMLARDITPDDKIIVLASDGVFEFLTNQSVIDICAKFSDPLEACRAVVAESYELWLQYELRTDDITMICIFIDDVDTAMLLQTSLSTDKRAPESPEEENHKEDELVSGDSRPVRKNISLEKSRALMKSKATSIRDVTDQSEEDFDIESLYNEKTDDEKARIAEAIRASVMFQNITDAQRELIYSVMEPMPVKKGQWIIKQGTVGDRFYIVDDGKFEVRIVPDGEEDTNNDGGNVVHTYAGSRGHSHPSFGELALLYSAPRAASIIAQTDGQLWALHRYAFKKIVAEQGARKDAEKLLKKIDVFKSFSMEDLKDLASYLCDAKYVNGDTIIKEGETGDSIFIILPGGSCGKWRGDCVGRRSMFCTLTLLILVLLLEQQNAFATAKATSQ
jgi:CRP-like cAMP-binding protein